MYRHNFFKYIRICLPHIPMSSSPNDFMSSCAYILQSLYPNVPMVYVLMSIWSNISTIRSCVIEFKFFILRTLNRPLLVTALHWSNTQIWSRKMRQVSRSTTPANAAMRTCCSNDGNSSENEIVAPKSVLRKRLRQQVYIDVRQFQTLSV